MSSVATRLGFIPFLVIACVSTSAIDAYLLFTPLLPEPAFNRKQQSALTGKTAVTRRLNTDTAALEETPIFFEGRRTPVAEAPTVDPGPVPDIPVPAITQPASLFEPMLLGTRQFNSGWQALIRFHDGAEPLWCSAGTACADINVITVGPQSATLSNAGGLLDIYMFPKAK